MLDSLFEGSAFKMFLVRWFGRERPTNAGRRGRQARLAVVDAANVDGRRKLVLIRRDNLEHLVLIGGPSDVLIEPNIAAGAAPREVPPPRPVPTGDTLRSHRHLRITPGEWDAFMDDVAQTLDKFAVPAAERAEVVAIVESTRADIVV